MAVLHVVPHTHWDREWYLPFQAFRTRLIRLVEELLDILEADPTYRSFTLDGQAIILEDVAEVRPDLAERLRRQIRDGRVLIGPWYVLPDEFLVSPEALVRNLLVGDSVCRAWGGKMDIGYLPDTFGHISQLPQLLRGFGMATAMFARGAGDAPTEFLWRGPDGSHILVCHLRDHYDNAAVLPADPDEATQTFSRLRDRLAPHAPTSQLLMMHGTDHMRPRADLPQIVAAANRRLPDQVILSSPVHYVSAVREELGPEGLQGLPLRSGEMRSPQRSPILPGVLSARMWIKQRNHACQVLLERWAEPFGALYEMETASREENAPHPPPPARVSPLTRLAWRYLLQNHPHDSICGCSVDQVHREMAVRFDWCEQLGEEVVRAALTGLAARVDSGKGDLPAVVVFNPCSTTRTDRVEVSIVPPIDPERAVLIDGEGHPVPFRVLRHTFRSEMSLMMDPADLKAVLSHGVSSSGEIYGGWRVQDLQVWADGEDAYLHVVATSAGGIPTSQSNLPLTRLQDLLTSGRVKRFHVRLREDEALEIAFVARDLPPMGYAAYRFVPRSAPVVLSRPEREELPAIENEYYRVEADPQTATVTVIERATGREIRGCHRLVSGGDRGDEYNYCPPENDELVDTPWRPATVHRQVDGVSQALVIEAIYRIPEGLDSVDRSRRSDTWVEVPVTVRVRLTPGVRRVEFETTIDNRAKDHRLRVHFPVPLTVDHALVEGHWDLVECPVDPPAGAPDWAEAPAATRPQRGWVDISDGSWGVAVLNRGLPEVEVSRTQEGTEIALTLLRCVGWLSRGDLPCRPGYAGPALPTPEAQCLGRHTFQYALVLHPGDWRAVISEAEAFQTELRAVSVHTGAGSLPARASFVTVDPPCVQISALKTAQEGQDLILRLWNPKQQTIEATVQLWRRFSCVTRTDMAEQAIAEVARETDSFRVGLRGREVATFALTL